MAAPQFEQHNPHPHQKSNILFIFLWILSKKMLVLFWWLSLDSCLFMFLWSAPKQEEGKEKEANPDVHSTELLQSNLVLSQFFDFIFTIYLPPQFKNYWMFRPKAKSFGVKFCWKSCNCLLLFIISNLFIWVFCVCLYLKALCKDGSSSDAASCISTAGDAVSVKKSDADVDTDYESMASYPTTAYYGYSYPGLLQLLLLFSPWFLSYDSYDDLHILHYKHAYR